MKEFREFREFREVFLNSLNSLNSLYNLALFAPQPNFSQEGVRLGLDKEIAPDGTYLAYFPFGARIERSRMTPYHKKLKEVFSKTTLSRLLVD